MFNIVKAQESDFNSIKECILGIAEYEKLSHEVIWSDEQLFNELFVEKSAQVVLAKEDEKVVGFALYFFNFSTFVGKKGLYLEDLFVFPENRGKGYGKKLFLELTKIAKEKNCGRMEWCCLNWNTPSIEFYESLGASGLTEWTTWRLKEEDLDRLSAI